MNLRYWPWPTPLLFICLEPSLSDHDVRMTEIINYGELRAQ